MPKSKKDQTEKKKLELRAIRVLVFVDEDVAKALLPPLFDLGPIAKQTHDLTNEIVEIERTKRAQHRLVSRKNFLRDLVVLVI